MQSFKEYLQEKHDDKLSIFDHSNFCNDPIFSFVLTNLPTKMDEMPISLQKLEGQTTFSAKYIRALTQKLNSELSQQNIDYDFNLMTITADIGGILLFVKIKNETSPQAVRNHFVEYLEKIIDSTVDIKFLNCWIGNLDFNFKVEAEEIVLSSSKDLTLQDIHKKISCEKFKILDHNFKITGNVLGLLKLPLNLFFISTPKPKWAEIVEKYLHNKDVVACAEKLIENGFKEYAKF